jgi:FkbM family methyltransferase
MPLFITYSQNREDLILYHALLNIHHGFYIDVGANSPNWMSVTKAFYLRNWSGVNIEPLLNNYQELLHVRRRDLNLNIGCGAKFSSFAFWENGGLSTMDPREGKKFGPPTRIVSVYPLSEIIRNYSITVCHFCKIDVEGFEREVLSGIDFKEFRPWTFCIEATLPGTEIPCHDKWEYILLNADYKLGCAYGINRYYYDGKLHPELAQTLICRGAFDKYRIFGV